MLEKNKEFLNIIELIKRKRDIGWVTIEIKPLEGNSNDKEVLKKNVIELGFIYKDKEDFLKKINREKAYNIFRYLIRYDIAYDTEIFSKDEKLSKMFFNFVKNARYYSNSTWNKPKHSENYKPNNFGLHTWNPLIESTFDSGIIIFTDNDFIIAWFEDEE